MCQPKDARMWQRERNLSYSTFCSILAVNRLGEAHPHQGGQSALLSLLTAMVISSGSTLQTHPEYWGTKCLGARGPVELTCKMSLVHACCVLD